jgi:hypothetical protein
VSVSLRSSVSMVSLVVSAVKLSDALSSEKSAPSESSSDGPLSDSIPISLVRVVVLFVS